MNFLFYLKLIGIINAESRRKKYTRYECEYNITVSKNAGCIGVDISVGNSKVNFCAKVVEPSNTVVTLNVTKMQRIRSHYRTRTEPWCNGHEASDQPIELNSFGYKMTIRSRTVFNYNPKKHWEDCHDNEIGYPQSNTCNANGSLCISQLTGYTQCRCKNVYMGLYCDQINWSKIN